jgi:hypothetical protein
MLPKLRNGNSDFSLVCERNLLYTGFLSVPLNVALLKHVDEVSWEANLVLLCWPQETLMLQTLRTLLGSGSIAGTLPEGLLDADLLVSRGRVASSASLYSFI